MACKQATVNIVGITVYNRTTNDKGRIDSRNDNIIFIGDINNIDERNSNRGDLAVKIALEADSRINIMPIVILSRRKNGKRRERENIVLTHLRGDKFDINIGNNVQSHREDDS